MTTTAEAPTTPAVGERPEPSQLQFAGMPEGDVSVNLIGPVTLSPATLEALALGQTLTLKVTARVQSVGGRVKRNQWGDDEADVRWQLYAEEATVK